MDYVAIEELKNDLCYQILTEIHSISFQATQTAACNDARTSNET